MNAQRERRKMIMLGGSGCGKTCYMLAMYGAMRVGRHGFAITTNPDENVRLNKSWDDLNLIKGRDRWPEGTVGIKNYSFELSSGLESILRFTKFDWLDYRGGAMSEEGTIQEVAVLRQHIADSSGFFLCISGEHLREPVTNYNVVEIMSRSQSNLMTNYLIQHGRNIPREKREYFPIIITITKYDLCCSRDHDELIKDVKQIFPALFTPNSNWLVMICPVTLGTSLANNKDEANLFPQNIHFPLIFAVYCMLKEICEKQVEIVSNKEQTLKNFLAAHPLIQWINRGKISKLEAEIKKIDSDLDKVGELIDQIKEELNDSDANIYFNGRQLDLL